MRVVGRMTRTRRLIGLLTLLAIVAIVISITGFELPLPRFGVGTGERAQVAGVRAVTANTLLRVGSGAPPGGELAFMAVDPSRSLVVSDAKRRTVMRFDPTGHLLSEWGPRLGELELAEPAGVAVSGANYYVVDRGTPRIFRLDSSGQVQAMLSLEALGTYGLNGMAVDANGNLYVADTGRNRILVFAPTGQLIKQVGHSGNDLGGFTQPMMLAFAPDSSFFVADWENNRIERWNADFDATDAWSIGFHAFGVAVDQTGRIFAPDADHRRVEVFSPQGAPLGEMGAPSVPALELSPRQVALGRTEQPTLYVMGNDAIQRLDLENTAPPAQSGASSDLIGVIAIVLLAALVGLAVLSRRQRRRATASLGSALDRPIGLHTENGAQRQEQQAEPDQKLLIAHQAKREQ